MLRSDSERAHAAAAATAAGDGRRVDGGHHSHDRGNDNNNDDDDEELSSYVYSSSNASDATPSATAREQQQQQRRQQQQQQPQHVQRVATTTAAHAAPPPPVATTAPPSTIGAAVTTPANATTTTTVAAGGGAAPAVVSVPQALPVAAAAPPVAQPQLQVDYVPMTRTVELRSQQHQHHHDVHVEHEMRVVTGSQHDGSYSSSSSSDGGTSSSTHHHHHHHRHHHHHQHIDDVHEAGATSHDEDSEAAEKRLCVRTTRFVQRVLVYVFLLFTFVQLLFDILACALSQLDEVGGGCYTYWGYKAVCNSVVYTRRTALLFACTTLRSYLMAGAAFSILSILGATVAFVLAWVLCCVMRAKTRYERVRAVRANVDVLSFEQYMHHEEHLPPFHFVRLKTAILVVSVVTLVFELIAWAVIAGAFGRRLCEDRGLMRTMTYGVGFGLGLTAWVLGVLVLVVFILFV